MIAYSAKNAKVRFGGFEVPVKEWSVVPDAVDLEYDHADFAHLFDSPTMTGAMVLDDNVSGIQAMRHDLTLTMAIPNPTAAHKFARHPKNRRWRRRETYYRKTAMQSTWTFPNVTVTKQDGNGIEFTVNPLDITSPIL